MLKKLKTTSWFFKLSSEKPGGLSSDFSNGMEKSAEKEYKGRRQWSLVNSLKDQYFFQMAINIQDVLVSSL